MKVLQKIQNSLGKCRMPNASIGGRWIAKKRKEHLFCNAIHGIIESIDKMIIQKKDWFYGKYGS